MLHTQRNLLQNLLLAPVVGVTATLLPIFWLNHAGMPISKFAVPMTVCILLLQSIMFVWLKPVIPFKKYLPYFGMLLLALFITGRPMLTHGFDWVSYCNGDMATYALSADRILNHGFFDVPDTYTLTSRREYSLSLWFLSVVLGHRSGAEMLLAWAMRLTGINGPNIYMSLLMSLHLVLISAASGLALQSRRFRAASLMTCFLLAVSALTSLGTLYQLMPQVIGIGLLLCATTLLLRSFSDYKRFNLIKHGILSGSIISALFVAYPEVWAFLFFASSIYILINIFQRKAGTINWVSCTIVALFTWLLLLNNYWLISFGYGLSMLGGVGKTYKQFFSNEASQTGAQTIAQTVTQTQGTDSVLLFPHFFVPSGLANFWGFSAIANYTDTLLSVSIAAGMILLPLSVLITLWQLKKLCPPAFVVVAMILAAAFLFIKLDGFGLFKLSMFVQPFLIATLAMFATPCKGSGKAWRFVLLIVLGVAGLPTQKYYIDASYKETPGKVSYVEIRRASSSQIFSELQKITTELGNQTVYLDTPNLTLSKIQPLYTKQSPTISLGNVFTGFSNEFGVSPFLDQATLDQAILLDAELRKGSRYLRFNFLDPSNPAAHDIFESPAASNPNQSGSGSGTLISLGKELSIINRWHRQNNQALFISQPRQNYKNHLVYTNSQLGPLYSYNAFNAGLYQLESDPIIPGQSVAAIGRYLLFLVINPSEELRLTINLSRIGVTSLLPSQAVAIGATRVPFKIEGKGSGRVFSAQLRPQIIEGQAYVAIDLGVNGVNFPDRRKGLMTLFGQNITLDVRKPVALARDISAISEAEYNEINPPSKLKNFSNDLLNSEFEYSGLFENGLSSPAVMMQLTQPPQAMHFVIKGSVLHANTSIQIFIEDKIIGTQTVADGAFALKFPIEIGQGKKRIKLSFLNSTSLKNEINLERVAKLSYIGFE